MCGGVVYRYEDRDVSVYFPNPKALLPVKTQGNSIVLIPWGRRQGQHGHLPLGGWARLESIRAGLWDKYFPKPVKIPVAKFMEKDIVGQSQWFEVTQGHWIQGLLVKEDEITRVYVVTLSPTSPDAAHERWPRILSN